MGLYDQFKSSNSGSTGGSAGPNFGSAQTIVNNNLPLTSFTTIFQNAIGFSPSIMKQSIAPPIYYEGYIYIIGGVNGSSNVKDVYRIDALTGEIKKMADMVNPKSQTRAVAMNGKIYVAGSINGSTPQNFFEEYDIATNTWSVKTSLPSSKTRVQIAAVDNKVYVMGGWNGSVATTTVDIYDTITNTWSAGPALSVGRSTGQAAIINKTIYLFGGVDNNMRALNTSVTPLAWVAKAALPVYYRYEGGAVGVMNGKMYTGFGGVHSFEEYDPNTNTWAIKINATFSSDTTFAIIYPENGKLMGIQFEITSKLINRTYLDIDNGKAKPVFYDFTITQNTTPVVIGTKLYGLGALSPFQNVLQEYDMETKESRLLSSAPLAITGSAAVEYNGKMYVTGSNIAPSNMFQVYDIATDTWTQLPNTNKAYYFHKSWIYDNKLYVAGGTNNTQSMEYFDFNTQTWDIVTAVVSLIAPGVQPVGDIVYFIGGKNSSNVVSTNIQIYDMKDRIFYTPGFLLPAARSNHSSAYINGLVYNFAGSNGSTSLVTMDILNPNDTTVTTKPLGIVGYSISYVFIYKGRMYFVDNLQSSIKLLTDQTLLYTATTNMMATLVTGSVSVADSNGNLVGIYKTPNNAEVTKVPLLPGYKVFSMSLGKIVMTDM